MTQVFIYRDSYVEIYSFNSNKNSAKIATNLKCKKINLKLGIKHLQHKQHNLRILPKNLVEKINT